MLMIVGTVGVQGEEWKRKDAVLRATSVTITCPQGHVRKSPSYKAFLAAWLHRLSRISNGINMAACLETFSYITKLSGMCF